MKRLLASAAFAIIASLGLGTGAAQAVGANVIIILSTDARPFDVTVTVEDGAGLANGAPCAQPAYTVGGVSVWHGVDGCRNDAPTWIRVGQ
jgi:hypothetical protein